MLRRLLFAFAPLLLLIALPLALRPPQVGDRSRSDLTLRIITPNNESIRYEFARAFAAHYAQTHGEHVQVEWLTPGGTSDITRFINDQFLSSFRRFWTNSLGKTWTDTVATSFNNRHIDPDDNSVAAAARAARAAFLGSNVGIDIDLFFGGGQFDHQRQASMGHAVDAGIAARQAQWFQESVIPRQFSGETFYADDGTYYGTCLSAFGICYNLDRIAELSRKHGRDCTPRRWQDLADPIFFRQTALADPTKSGSITKCFEMLIQQQMQLAVAAAADLNSGLDQGWADGANMIKRIAANASYITDSASKVPQDVALGNTTAGMSIDFYGRTQAEWTAFQSGGGARMAYVTPLGGSSISADPIQLLRGAPNRQLAIDFIEFVLSPAGQKLWNYRSGTPGGPQKYVLRRLPVRRDMYMPEHRQHMADADVQPFDQEEPFVYEGAWTGRYFNLIRVLIKCMVLEPFPELQAAWSQIISAGGPQQVPEAMAAFNRLPFTYANASAANRQLYGGSDNDQLQALRTQRHWAESFRANYREAAALAKAGR